jgi:serine protease Do
MRLLSLLIAPTFFLACQMPPVQAQSPETLDEVFDRVHLAVVTLRTSGRDVDPGNPARFSSVAGVGSGVLFTGDGDILTAAHVVQAADEVVVEFPSGEVALGAVISSVPDADIALVRVVGPLPKGVLPAALGDSDQVRVGQRVFVVGAPLGITHTLTVGHISARRLDSSGFSSMGEPVEFFQTDAAINQGNSGGPMFDMKGRVVGIVSHIVSKSGGHQGLGFAVTSNVARSLVVDARPFWSGVHGVFIDGRMAELLNTPGARSGYLVQRVAKNSPAEALGIEGGDVLVTIQGQEVLLGGDIILEVQGLSFERETLPGIRERLANLKADEDVSLVVLRGGALLKITGRLPVP